MQRRHLLRAGLGSLAAIAFAGPSRLALAQACGARTEPNIEGPFYLPNAPERSVLSEHWTHRISITGTVRDTACRPLANTAIEVWQADAEGDYDLTGDRFRGVLRTDAAGRYELVTIEPGRYLNGATYRPAHIHVKVHATGRPVLTTQLYFPRDPENDSDPWFRDSLLLRELPLRPAGCHPQPRELAFDFTV